MRHSWALWSQKACSMEETRQALPMRHTSGADQATVYWSLFNFRFPQSWGLRSNARPTCRFSALSMPMRAWIMKSRPSAAPIRYPIAVCRNLCMSGNPTSVVREAQAEGSMERRTRVAWRH